MKTFKLLVIAVVFAPAALSQHQVFAVNPDGGEINMTLKTNHEQVNGSFHIQSGSIEFDRGSPHMSGSIVVLAASGKTGNDSRDKRMYKEVLRVKQYATVSFEPKSYTGTIAPSGQSSIEVKGNLTLLGKPHEITIPMLVYLDGAKANAKAHFVIPYVQWGLKNPSLLIWKAENDVAIDLFLTGKLSN